jgi:hypothetical protein
MVEEVGAEREHQEKAGAAKGGAREAVGGDPRVPAGAALASARERTRTVGTRVGETAGGGRGAPHRFLVIQQRECTVGTWVGATVGRGGGHRISFLVIQQSISSGKSSSSPAASAAGRAAPPPGDPPGRPAAAAGARARGRPSELRSFSALSDSGSSEPAPVNAPRFQDEGNPSPRTNWTRRGLHPVLIGHAASFTPY